MNNNDIFTSVVRVKGNGKFKVVPVKSTAPVSKELWTEFSKVIGRIYVSIPINIGDVICRNVMNTGIDIVCTRKIDKR